MTHVLDNPVWHALTSGNRSLGLGSPTARYFPREVAPFAGLAAYTPASYEGLYHVVPDGQSVALFTPTSELHPASWRVVNRIDGYQMVFEHQRLFDEPVTDEIVSLQALDVPAMLVLTGLTRPGPFSVRTIDFGGYEGIFVADQLVAMAGRRFHAGSYWEISAVCTHPDYVGKGYARQLIRNQIRAIEASGQTAYLHVRADNVRAVEVYQKMGFTIRRDMFIHNLIKG